MFKHKVEDFKTLFQGNNPHDGTSLELLKQWGRIEGLLADLKTEALNGLSDDQTTRKARQQAFGLEKPQQKTFREMMLEAFWEDTTIVAIFFIVAASLLLGCVTQGVEKVWVKYTAILGVLTLIVTFQAWNNWKYAQKIKELNDLARRKNINVYRQGQVQNISDDQLLIGDVQIIQAGQFVQADGLLLEGDKLIVDEYSINGDSVRIQKSIPTWTENEKNNPFIISGSKIIEGTGKMLVLSVGQHRQSTKLKKVSIEVVEEEGPFMQKMGLVQDKLGLLGKVSGVITFLCIIGHMIHDAYISEDFVSSFFTWETLSDILEQLMTVVTIMWISEPSESPLAVTVALAYTITKTKMDNNMVRIIEVCERLGDTDDICTDMTGIITYENMSLSHMFIKQSTVDKITKGFMQEDLEMLFSIGIILNSTAEPIFRMNSSGRLIVEQVGDKAECALLTTCLELGYDYRALRKYLESNIIKFMPYSSNTKTMSVVAVLKELIHVFSKGDPESLIKNCVSYIDANGDTVPLTEQFKNTLLSKSRQFNEATLRSVLLAYRVVENVNEDTSNQDLEKNLIIIGLAGISNPIREEVPYAVQLCRKAEVSVRMITEENPELAVAIAKQVGILPGDYKKNDTDYTVMTGQQLSNFVEGLQKDDNGNLLVKNIENFKLVSDKLKVLAGASNTDKFTIITGLKQLDNIVATTGQDSKDVPLLKKVDIGFSLSNSGDEAIAASDVILLNNSFNSMVEGVKWGRNIIDSIRKYLLFQLTLTLCVLVIELFGAALFNQSPLSPMQMLFFEFVCDILVATALVTEPPSDELFEGGRLYPRNQTIFSPEMWKNVVIQVSLQITILGTILFKGPELFGVQSSIGVQEWTEQSGKHFCIFFHTFVLLHIFNQINVRKLRCQLNIFRNFFNNPLFVVILILILIIQFLCVEYGGEYFGTVPLSAQEHVLCLGLAVLPILLSPIFKKIVPASIFVSLSKRQIQQ